MLGLSYVSHYGEYVLSSTLSICSTLIAIVLTLMLYCISIALVPSAE